MSNKRNLNLIDPRVLETIQNLRLMDDVLMSKVFSDDIEITEFVLRILMNNNELKVLESHGQAELRNIFGRSIQLDILAEDTKHNLINVEIQRAKAGAQPKRARYHAAMLDSHSLEKNKDFNELKKTYIIFITEKDIWSKGLPIYEIEKNIKGANLPFQDDLNILYVNGEYRGSDPLGILMHDFNCKSTNEMKFENLAQKVRIYKQEPEGEYTMFDSFQEMCEVIAEERAVVMAEERAAIIAEERAAVIAEERAAVIAEERAAVIAEERILGLAKNLLSKGKLSTKEISDLLNLPIEKVQSLATSLTNN